MEITITRAYKAPMDKYDKILNTYNYRKSNDGLSGVLWLERAGVLTLLAEELDEPLIIQTDGTLVIYDDYLE